MWSWGQLRGEDFCSHCSLVVDVTDEGGVGYEAARVLGEQKHTVSFVILRRQPPTGAETTIYENTAMCD